MVLASPAGLEAESENVYVDGSDSPATLTKSACASTVRFDPEQSSRRTSVHPKGALSGALSLICAVTVATSTSPATDPVGLAALMEDELAASALEEERIAGAVAAADDSAPYLLVETDASARNTSTAAATRMPASVVSAVERVYGVSVRRIEVSLSDGGGVTPVIGHETPTLYPRTWRAVAQTLKAK